MKSSLWKLQGFALQRHEQRVDRDHGRGHSTSAAVAAADELLAAAQIIVPVPELRGAGLTRLSSMVVVRAVSDESLPTDMVLLTTSETTGRSARQPGSRPYRLGWALLT
ncbi:hypothetical protein U9M48_031712 [Paspalum notatum var. saurae]|uniref:Uncharacterized protein n=1 Tax=Paspalum notatum var. saurae TaxID=547442 RepID=A0AAQ3U368_PASNO